MRQVWLQEQTVKQDVLAVHSTWLQAVISGDVELLAQLLSREDINWLTSQRRQLLQGSMLDRQPLELSAAGQPVPMAINLAPDWKKAEITMVEAFNGGEEREPVMLEQTYLWLRWQPLAANPA